MWWVCGVQVESKRDSKGHDLSPPYLRSVSIGSVKDLKPLFDGLRVGKVVSGQISHLPCSGQDTGFHSSSLQETCNKISLVILQDFLQSS